MWIGYLRQSTAAVRRTPQFVGVDGLAEQTAVSSPAGRITKNGTASAFAAASWSHDANGYYLLGLSASHTDTIGAGTIQFAASASYLSVTLEFAVLHPAVYDWLFGSTAPSTYAGGSVTLAASQPDYAPATASALAALAATVGAAGAGLTAIPPATLAAAQPNYAPATQSALAGLVATVGTAGAGLTSIPRAGYKLASDGLDAIATAEPTVAADGPMGGWKFPQLFRWLVMRFSRASLTPDALTVLTLAGAVSTSQAVADDGAGNESTGAPQ